MSSLRRQGPSPPSAHLNHLALIYISVARLDQRSKGIRRERAEGRLQSEFAGESKRVVGVFESQRGREDNWIIMIVGENAPGITHDLRARRLARTNRLHDSAQIEARSFGE